ncbi:MAG: cofactor-independent phosphoglycerate mutase [Desulfobulbaceae bacterium]|uniref:Cofactor-independent phosphoglycerate mutase n=1 Tax=Candidatus Desulfatifera sulfidica TaxID=2841691 RepID=A0A8J6NB54_9BACT|nr:cofactor-independent phosphoglycerate mutase [Candidatus Desulfatifera sulfidica]
MKYLILVGDGMGDRPIKELNDRTVLQAARTPAMDQLCARSRLLQVQTVPEGFPPGSDVANLSLLGYRPEENYTGRAPLEAAAMGIELAPDETAFRCNLVTLEHDDPGHTRLVDYSAGHITTHEARELVTALQQECSTENFRFYPGINYRHILVVKGAYPDLQPVPPHDFIGRDVSPHWQRYMDDPTWKKLVLGAEQVLSHHPVNQKRTSTGLNPGNGIWLWGEGRMPQMTGIPERYNLQGSLISAVDLLKGLGVCAGLDILNIPGATGWIDTNYEGKAEAALNCLLKQDYVFVHVEAPDEAGHQGSLSAKLQAIEDFDSRIVAPILHGLRAQGDDFRMIVTMDHFTPLELRTHTSDPVPALLYDSREQETGCGLDFNEESGRQLNQNRQAISGEEMLLTLLERNNT